MLVKDANANPFLEPNVSLRERGESNGNQIEFEPKVKFQQQVPIHQFEKEIQWTQVQQKSRRGSAY
jgi:hypothetical protein